MTAGAGSPVPGAGSGAPDLMSLAGGDRRATLELIQELLREVIDPEIGINIIDLGLVYDVGLSSDGVALIRMTLTTPGCPLGGYIDDEIHNILWGAPGVEDIDVRIVWDPPWDPDEMMSDWAKDQLGWRR
jgi:metal-sulfur cluster biosynthetic enzyme